MCDPEGIPQPREKVWPLVRRLPRLLAVTAAAALVLTGCASPNSSGDAALLDSITVSGDEGAAPTVSFADKEKGIEISETSIKVLTEGKGDATKKGDLVSADILMVSPTTGESISQTPFDGTTPAAFTVGDEQLLPGITKMIEGRTPGSRVLGAIAPADAFGEAGQPQLGIEAGQGIVLVVDIHGVEPSKADGEKQEPVEGMPTVTLEDDGAPVISIPEGEPSPDLQLAVLQKGDGAEVAENANVVINYRGVVWRTGEEFDSSWSRGAPATMSLANVVPGFSKAIVGQTVGSQVIVTVPPKEGYGDEKREGAKFEPTDTLVFVIDILKVVG